MNKLPGSEIEKIRIAIVGAFPDDKLLRMFLREHLDINLSQYAIADDYDGIVFRLIERLESEGKLLKFIQKARKANPNSSSLKDLSYIPHPNNEQIPNDFKEEQRALIAKVKRLVIEEWLKKEFSNKKEPIELKLNQISTRNASQEELPEGTNITEEFRKMKEARTGRTLLILGAAGSGKTIALLQIIAELLKEPKLQLIPVYIYISSWSFYTKNNQNKVKGNRFVNWLVEELQDKYKISSEAVRHIVQEQKLLLCLDGLNELEPNLRTDFIKEFKNFRKKLGNTDIVISCRTEEYEMSHKLEVEKIIFIQPLKPQQVHRYLEEVSMESVSILFERDKNLEKFATTPLILSYIIKTYSSDNLPPQNLDRGRLLEDYIEQRFCALQNEEQAEQTKEDERKKIKRWLKKYPDDRVKNWLKYLAKQLSKNQIFYIENMQPECLDQKQKKFYNFRITWVYGILSGCPLGIVYGNFIDFWLSNLKYPPLFGPPLTGAVVGVLAALILGPLVTSYILKLHKRRIIAHRKEELSIQEALKALPQSLRSGVVIGLGIWVFCIVFLRFFYKCKDLWCPILFWVGAIAGVVLGVVVAVGHFIGNLWIIPNKIEDEFKPNQGIWNAQKKAFIIAVLATTVFYILYTITLVVLQHRGSIEMSPTMFIVGLFTAVATGIVAALSNSSGNSCFQHIALRLVLKKDELIPWNYADFLDYADKLEFLRAIGGSYLFRHQVLQEHFEQRQENSERLQ